MPRIPKHDFEGYLFIIDYFLRNKKPPSHQTIADHFGFGSKRSAQLMLIRLANSGRIKYEGGKIELLQDPATSTSESTVKVPIVGTGSCGMLDLAEEVFDEYVEVSTVLARPNHRYFILRANGQSMNLSGINDGDLVLVRQQATAQEGDRVVALVNNEASIKHFHRENGFVVLKPNSTDKTVKPIILSEEFIIQGVVVQTLPNPF